MTEHSPKIAWVSPFPPQKSGVANYSYWVVKALNPYIDIDLYYDRQEPSVEIQREFDVYPISVLPDRLKEYDETVYHLGNHSGFHKKIYELAWNFPATIVLHDYNLSAFMRDAFYRKANMTLYEQALVNGSDESEHNVLNGLLSRIGRNVETNPMSHAVVNRSRKVIVHHRWIKNQFPKSDHIRVIPHFAQINHHPTAKEIDSFKTRFLIKESDFLISCLGFTNTNKLPGLQVKVVEKLLAQGYPAHLLFAGETAPDVRRLQAEVESGSNRENITFTGYLDDIEYFSAIFASDVIINLRNPSMGEASGTLMQALAAGKPTIISDLNQYKEFPDRVCWKVAHDGNEVSLLYEYIAALLANKNLRASMSANSVDYIQGVFALPRIIAQWLRVIANTHISSNVVDSSTRSTEQDHAPR
jgi:glycosyltransferase involved in cell wall biosynthesis